MRAQPPKDTRLDPPGGASLAGAMVAAVLLLPSATAQAEALRDPTRPVQPPAVAPAALAAAPAAGASSPAAETHRLQATQRRSNGRWAALIDGRWLEVGASLGDLRVATITEADVVLTRGTERLTLTLLPVRRQTSTAQPTRTSP